MTDVVGIFDADFQPLVPEAQPIKATVTQPSKVMEHPLETGGTVSDHRVFQPVEIEMTVVVPFADFPRLQAIYRQTETVAVRTNVGTFDNMIIETLPHDETPDVFDKVAVAMKLREVQFVEAQFQALPPRAVGGRGNRNASTVKRGEQSGQPATAGTERRAGAALRLFERAGIVEDRSGGGG